MKNSGFLLQTRFDVATLGMDAMTPNFEVTNFYFERLCRDIEIRRCNIALVFSKILLRSFVSQHQNSVLRHYPSILKNRFEARCYETEVWCRDITPIFKKLNYSRVSDYPICIHLKCTQ